jgi:hypothetical protein
MLGMKCSNLVVAAFQLTGSGTPAKKAQLQRYDCRWRLACHATELHAGMSYGQAA